MSSGSTPSPDDGTEIAQGMPTSHSSRTRSTARLDSGLAPVPDLPSPLLCRAAYKSCFGNHGCPGLSHSSLPSTAKVRTMGSLLGLLVVSALAATAPSPSSTLPAPPKDASLLYVAQFQPLAGISYGMTAVDGRPLILDQRVIARVAPGLRTVWYSCPNGSKGTGGSRLSFNFKAGQAYELACREGQQAEIRVAGC